MKKILLACYRRVIWFFFTLLPIQRKKIVLISFGGAPYGGNPKYIAETLLASHTKFKLIWLTKGKPERASVPEGIRAVRFQSTAAFYHIATARVWVNNARNFYYNKRKKQFYINTWHGFALKQIEKDAISKLPAGYAAMAIADSKAIDLIISEASFMTKIYKQSFWYDGEVWEIGSPRNDIIINQRDGALCKKVHEAFSLPKDKKIILYAPTFRADCSLDCYRLDYAALRDACERKFGGEFVTLVRLHPKIAQKCSEVCEYTDTVLNASPYPDMQELLVAADIVVTDYSSLMFDFSLSLKPCFQFATDIEDYKRDRNFYFPIESLPFPLATSNEELKENIQNFNLEEFQNGVNAFFDKVGMVREGRSAEKCCTLISDLCSK